jgi:6-phosphogluconolactonase
MSPEIKIYKDLASLSEAAKNLLIEACLRAISESGQFLVALCGGNTPMALYRLLVDEPLDWADTHVFWGDERCVPMNDPGNCYGQAWDILLSQVQVPPGNVHRIQSELEPVVAARDYARLLREFRRPPLDWPRFDLVLLGLGEDGHTASLFPGSPVDITEPVITVTAHYQDRPARRVTLTPAVINDAWQIVFLVSGQSKSKILASVLKGDYHPENLPAQRIQPKDGKLLWLVDEAAGSML